MRSPANQLTTVSEPYILIFGGAAAQQRKER